MSELRRPSSLPPLWVVLTIPVVTVFCRENGLPMATTNSPGRRSAERPSSSTGSLIYTARGSRTRERVWGWAHWLEEELFGWLSSGPGGGASRHLPSLVMGKTTHLCNNDTYFECESGERSLACIELVSCRDISTLHASYWIASFLFLMKQ